MAAIPEKPPLCYQIDDLTVDTGSRSVSRRGEPLDIGGLTFELLVALAESAPAMASYDSLIDRVWKGRDTSPATIAQRAKMLRAAISDDAASPRYFELVRGQGYRMVADVRELSAPAGRPRNRRWTAAMAIAVVIAVGLLLAYLGKESEPVYSSIAVLPFEDLSEGADQQYLADGIAEELINELARLDGLHVASRSESFFFRGPAVDLQEIGDTLNVATVVEGSVRKLGDALRVTVQLIEVDDGFHLWTQTFDSSTGDLFDIQEAIAKSVAGSLGVKLGVGGSNEFHGAGTRNFEAYEAFLRKDFEKAIELDPDYAAAWARQGFSIAATVWASMPEEAPEIIENAHRHVVKAIQLDPNSAQAHADFAALSFARMEWEKAEQSYATALDLSRNAHILTMYGNMMMRAGRARKAVEIYAAADALRRAPWPIRSGAMMFRSNVHIALKQVDAARHQTELMHEEVRRFNNVTLALNFGSADDVRAAIEAVPQGTPDYSFLYASLIELLDDPEKARAFLLDLAADPERAWPYKFETIALLMAYFGDPEAALDVFLDELQYSTIRFGSLWFPVMSEVRQLPKFRQFLTDIQLVDYWREFGWTDFCRPVSDNDFVCE